MTLLENIDRKYVAKILMAIFKNILGSKGQRWAPGLKVTGSFLS